MIGNVEIEILFFQTVLDALDKTTQEVAESCSHLMPIQDKATVMASSSTEFQWLAGKFTPPKKFTFRTKAL
jgi:hypothetical protein